MKPPLIIIGAGRSGTNALRDALCSLSGFATWPCDEINYIWRYGNRDHPDDELRSGDASDASRAYIRRAFEKRQKVEPSAHVVEKTCANSLRVEFVHAVLPEARFVHLIRNGGDVTLSAMDRWTAPLDLPYLARKARFVPAADLGNYAVKYLSTRLAKRGSDDERLSWWGPRFEGHKRFGPDDSLAEIAAAQWAACVLRASDHLDSIPEHVQRQVLYQDLVADPQAALLEICDLMEVDSTDAGLEAAASTIRRPDPGRPSWEDRLGESDVQRVRRHIEPVIESLDLPI